MALPRETEEFFSERPISLGEVIDLLGAEFLSGADLLDRSFRHVLATDLMSAVLASAEAGALLLTGLDGVQVINTADIVSLGAVIFVGGRRPPAAAAAKASALAIPTLTTSRDMSQAWRLILDQARRS